MPTTKKSSKNRVQKWRKSLKARGGKEVRLALEKRAVDQLERLQRYYGGITYADVVSLALSVLDRQKTHFKPVSILEGKGQDVEGKE